MKQEGTADAGIEKKAAQHGTRVLRAAVGGLALNILTNGFLFIGNLLIARILPREEYATFVVSISLVAVFAIIADLGMTSLFTRLFAEAEERVAQGGPDERGELLGTSLILRVALAGISCLGIIFIAPLFNYSAAVLQQTHILLITLFISSRLIIVRAVGEAFLRGRGKYYLALAFSTLDAALFAGLIVYASSRHLTLSAITQIYAFNHLPGFLMLVGVILLWIRREQIRLSFSSARLKALLWMGLPIGIGISLQTLHTEADKLLLDKLSDYMQVSAFGAGYRVMTAISFLPLVMAAVTAPEITRLIARGEFERTRRLVDLSIRALLTLAGGIAIVLSCTSDVVVQVLGEKYLNVSNLVIVLGWLGLPVFFSTYLLEMTMAAGRLRLVALYGAILVVVSVSVDLLLLPSMGAMGALVSKGLAVSIGSAVLLILERDQAYLDIPLFLSFIWRLAVALGASLAAREIAGLLGANVLVISVASVLTFVAGIHFTHAVRFSEAKSMLLRMKGGSEA